MHYPQEAHEEIAALRAETEILCLENLKLRAEIVVLKDEVSQLTNTLEESSVFNRHYLNETIT